MLNIDINVILKKLKKVYKNKKYELHSPKIIGNEKKYLNDCLNNRSITIGSYKNRLEKKIKNLTKAKYVILTSSGTAAIHLTLKALKVNKKHEVLMPSLNYVASANSVLYCNSSPHFIDVESETLGVDPVKLKSYLNKIVKKKKNISYNKKTKKIIKAIIILHVFGHPCKIAEIKKICNKFNIQLIEDAAEGLGSFFKHKHIGSFGKVGILSFNGNKIVTTGSGGAVITNDKKIALKIEKLSKISKKNHKYKYDYDDIGYNYNMPNINAALGLAQIENLRKFLKKKRSLYNELKRSFKDYKNCKILEEPKNCRSNYWLQTLIINSKNMKFRNKVIEKLTLNGLQSRPIWKLLHKIRHLNKFQSDDLKTSIKLEKKIINIPSNIN